MTLDQIAAGVASYVEQEIAAPAPTGLQKFVYYAAVPFVSKSILQMGTQYKALAISMGLLDDNGNWDVSELRNAAIEAIKKTGPFQFAGVIIKSEDIDKLWSYLN